MALLRRDGRLRPSTLWAVFVIALLLGAAAGWLYRSWTHRDVGDPAAEAREKLQRSVDQVTK